MRRRATERAPHAAPRSPRKFNERWPLPRGLRRLQFPAPPLKTPTTVGVFVFVASERFGSSLRWARFREGIAAFAPGYSAMGSERAKLGA
jgi:hypothetical protein